MNGMLLNNYREDVFEILSEGLSLYRDLDFLEERNMLDKKIKEFKVKQKPTIMFYGVYNSGKSTTLNAICGKHIAATGDIPTTEQIQEIDTEGYLMIDTPGINANDAHTQVATKEVENSDLILFVMDNISNFESAVVYRVISEIIQKGKDILIVINQKHLDESDSDEVVEVSQQASITNVRAKIDINLRKQADKDGYNLREKKNMLGIIPIHAKMAEDKELYLKYYPIDEVLRLSGISQLKMVMDETIRKSGRISLLKTPLIYLKEQLQQTKEDIKSNDFSNREMTVVQNRDLLVQSRDRLRNRLLSDGLRIIEGAFEEIRTLSSAGKPFDNAVESINQKLTALIKDVSKTEMELINVGLKELSIDKYDSTNTEQRIEAAIQTSTNNLNEVVDILAEIGTILGPIITPTPIPSPIPVPLIVMAIKAVIKIVSFFTKENNQSEEQVHNQESQKVKAYYNWLNQLREKESAAKSEYTSNIRMFIEKNYQSKLERLDDELEEINNDYAKYQDSVLRLENLVTKIDAKMIELGVYS